MKLKAMSGYGMDKSEQQLDAVLFYDSSSLSSSGHKVKRAHTSKPSTALGAAAAACGKSELRDPGHSDTVAGPAYQATLSASQYGTGRAYYSEWPLDLCPYDLQTSSTTMIMLQTLRLEADAGME